jgi:hypothetical protein
MTGSDSQAQWWRVHYWLYAAGGGMTPTWMGLAADSAEDAIAKVRAAQNRRDASLGRARCGYFKGATAEPMARQQEAKAA